MSASRSTTDILQDADEAYSTVNVAQAVKTSSRAFTARAIANYKACLKTSPRASQTPAKAGSANAPTPIPPKPGTKPVPAHPWRRPKSFFQNQIG
jgi:hypothetical protein